MRRGSSFRGASRVGDLRWAHTLGTLRVVNRVNLSNPLLAAIERALWPIEDVRAALLFGSRAAGGATAESDTDVAVLLSKGPQDTERKEVLASLIRALGSELRADRLDIVILNDAPSKLAFQVLKHGKVAFERDPVDLHRFRVRTYSRHADYEHVERFFRHATKARALREAARG